MASEEEIVALAGNLAGIVSRIAGQVQDLRSRLDAHQQALFNPAEDQNAQILALVAHVNGLSDRIGELGGEATAVTGLVDEVRDAIEMIAPTAEDETEPLESYVESISNYMQECMDESKRSIDDFLDAQRETLNTAVLQAGQELKDALSGELIEKVGGFLKELQEAVSEHVESLMVPLAAEIGNSVERLLDALTENLAQGDAETRRENAALEAAVDALKPAVDSLLTEFKRVTALAETVGL